MDDCSKNIENCLRDFNKILIAVASRYETSELEILYNKERRYLYVKFLIGLYLFNKGYRHREIGRVINADRTHVYYIIERATDIMKSRDKYYDQMKECVRLALCDIGSSWEIMTKFI
jgi:hypothetical protein